MKKTACAIPWACWQGFRLRLWEFFFLEPARASEIIICVSNISKITITLVYLFTSLFFTQDNISKESMYHTICVNYEAKIEAGVGAGTGAGPE